jgi:hypothetical protein
MKNNTKKKKVYLENIEKAGLLFSLPVCFSHYPVFAWLGTMSISKEGERFVWIE